MCIRDSDQFVDARHEVFEVVTRIGVLNDIAELLAVAGAPARIGIKHDVAFGGHPLEFMVEGVAICGMRAAMDIENQRIFLAGREVGRTLHPSLDAAAIEALVPNHFRLGEIEFFEQLVVDVGEPVNMARGAVEQEQIAYVGG